MAYYDENGTITIDEAAANADCNRIDKAIASLRDSQSALQNLTRQASDGKGQTAMASAEKSAELTGKIMDMITRLEETKSFIKKTVQHYQQVDAALKATIMSEDLGGAING